MQKLKPILAQNHRIKSKKGKNIKYLKEEPTCKKHNLNVISRNG